MIYCISIFQGECIKLINWMIQILNLLLESNLLKSGLMIFFYYHKYINLINKMLLISDDPLTLT